jgi:folate-binding protein YgfZ
MNSVVADLSKFLSVSTDGDEPGILSFGDPTDEYRALRDSVGIFWLSDQRAYRICGSERTEFLQRLLTGDIKGIAAGSCSMSLLLDNKGRAQVALEIGALANELIAVGATPQVDVGMETLARYVLRSDVQIEPLDSVALALIGPTADELIRGAQIDALERPPMAFRSAWGWLLVADAPVVAWKRLIAAGAVPVGRDAAETLRIEARQPQCGNEITGAEFPQELRLEAAIDFDKGCYLGQETVARIHYRGQVNRLLCVLRCDGGLQVGDTLRAKGKDIGQVTSMINVVGSDTVALGFVARGHSDIGARLTTSANVSVTVVEAAP